MKRIFSQSRQSLLTKSVRKNAWTTVFNSKTQGGKHAETVIYSLNVTAIKLGDRAISCSPFLQKKTRLLSQNQFNCQHGVSFTCIKQSLTKQLYQARNKMRQLSASKEASPNGGAS
jgi:hypothetical protein